MTCPPSPESARLSSRSTAAPSDRQGSRSRGRLAHKGKNRRCQYRLCVKRRWCAARLSVLPADP
eukprot:5677789-Pleurochrysis_carterae.AAC.2